MQPSQLFQIDGYKDFVLISTRPKCSPSTDLDFEVIENPAERVEYDPAQSHLVAFAINYQSDEKFKAKTLGQSVVNDARIVSRTFVQVGVLPQSNAIVHEAKDPSNNCTFEGIKRCFIRTAKSVGRDGLFVFHFSGHGIRVGNDQWGLAPSDFDYTDRAYITASVLNNWLTEASCEAKHVLFTLDCCYAGGIADALTTTDISHRSLFIVSSCTANESSYAVNTLGHSVFSYFLAYAMRKCIVKSGDAGETEPDGGHRPPSSAIALQTIFTECHLCSEALSSLLVKYTNGSLHSAMTHPNIQILSSSTAKSFAVEETDSQPQLGRFTYVHGLYDQQKPIQPLHRDTENWLSSHHHPAGPLSKLQSRNLLQRPEVFCTTLCSMMYSVGSFQLYYDPATVACVNTFIMAYMNVASVIDLHSGGTNFSVLHLKLALGYYIEVLKKNNILFDPLGALYVRICRENNQPEEDTDGAAESTVSNGFSLITYHCL